MSTGFVGFNVALHRLPFLPPADQPVADNPEILFPPIGEAIIGLAHHCIGVGLSFSTHPAYLRRHQT